MSLPTTVVSVFHNERTRFRFARYVLSAAGIFLISWALSTSQFRDAEGALAGTVCLPIAAGVALLLAGWGVAAQAHRFAAWCALAIIGQALTLQLIDAGPFMRYQHYPVSRLLSTHPVLMLLLAVQTVIVGVGLRREWPRLRTWLPETFRLWQMAGIGLTFTLTSATVSPQVSTYITELIFATFAQALNLGTIVLAVLAAPDTLLQTVRHRFDSLFGSAGGAVSKMRIDRFVVAAAIWVIVLAGLLNVLSYQRHPHIPDEVIYLVHARYLAAGTLATPAPPVPDAFDVYLMQFDGARWYPSPPAGWPAILAVGMAVGLPWLVNPVLAGINLLLIYLLLQRLYSRRLARIAVLLFCVSPWYVFMSMNFMTHTFTLTCALLAAVAVERGRDTDQIRWGLLAGAALGAGSLIRPLDGLIVAVLVGLWSIGIGGRRLAPRLLVALGVSTAVVGSIVFPYNYVLTGDPTVFPIMEYTDQRFGPNANAYGFGPDRGMDWPIDPNPGHSPIDGLINMNLNTFSINVELFGWGIGSLLFAAIFLVSGQYRRSDYMMLAVIVTVVGLYFPYYFSGGPDFGARYWYIVIVPLVALTVRGIEYLERSPRRAGTRVLLGVTLLSALTLLNVFPWRAIDKYYHYLGMRPDIRTLAQEYDFGKSLVLVRGDEHPDYASAFVYTPIDVYADEPVYVWNRDPETRRLVLSAYADRPVWLVDGPSITQSGFRVVAGPLPPASRR